MQIEVPRGGGVGIDRSPTFDWDTHPNPRYGIVRNAARRWAKRGLRWARNTFFSRHYGINFGPDGELVTERHHNAYGTPWAVGREQFDYLVARGLEPSHVLADVGCGPLRTGVWIVEYLDEGHYFGIDKHARSLQAAAEYELPLHGLEHKRPRLLNDGAFSLDHFETEFDWVISFSVFIHLTAEETQAALAQITKHLRPGGRFVINQASPLPLAVMRRVYGLELVHQAAYPCRLLVQGTGWVEFVKDPGEGVRADVRGSTEIGC